MVSPVSRAYAGATVSLIRWAGLLLVGLVGLVFSICRLGPPAQAVEQTGGLYQHSGSDGIAYGMIALTVCMTLLRAVLTWRAWRSLRH